MRPLRHLPLAIAAALGASGAHGVQLGTNGSGQALIFPYYTVRTAQGGNAFNTYLTVVNATNQAKAVRVRLREGRAGRAVLDFNLYLSPNDVWASAVVPTADGAQLITTDTSCTDPAFSTGTGSTFLTLNANGYTGTNADGFGDTLDRTREGYVEMIEMATLTGLSAQAVTHNSAGVPANCAAIRTTPVATAPPGGGLSGTLTLINVNNGQDFTLDATPLADLSTRQFFRPPADPYPDFAAAEIDPVSAVVANGSLYRSLWSRPVDAVSAVLMRPVWTAEFVLDNGTASFTDVVATLPTRHYYVSASGTAPPFSGSSTWSAGCVSGTQVGGEDVRIRFFNREEAGGATGGGGLDPPAAKICAAAAVGWIHTNALHMPPANAPLTAVLGSTTGGLTQSISNGTGVIGLPPGFQNGWLSFTAQLPANQLVSLPASTRTDLATGTGTAGAHRFSGLPVVGFSARTFANGTLQCDGASRCQGNYGGAFAFKYRRTIATP